MEIARTVVELRSLLDKRRAAEQTIGFVPTMGALHQGHVSLMEQAVRENSCAVVSIFVNPTQFNDPNDLKKYPRTPEKDLALVERAGVSVVFMPEVKEMYPTPDSRQFDFGMLDKVMEGVHRPGHFNGVAQVVSRLFDMVMPNRAYFGQKDFQQLAIIRQMVKMLCYPIEIIGCTIVREADGLAMSSRNMLLEPGRRQSAPLIAKTLAEARNKATQLSVKQLIDWVVSSINSDANLEVEYFEVVNAETLAPIEGWNDAPEKAGCIAVWAGSVRLIDNIMF
ncbi:MAG: pantoate--beta-alanine ligase [Bacteroidales bacterium]|nr:pantoate--beta-alanine ligase [Bacteroidales bacterium]MBN2750925.1 pantoate--beta-alanine ligase [Bacteroidales bacterium]